MDTTVYNTNGTLDQALNYLTIILGLALLICPLWLLQHFITERSNLSALLGIITGFLVVFIILINMFTVTELWRVLAATTAYAGFLILVGLLGWYANGSGGG